LRCFLGGPLGYGLRDLSATVVNLREATDRREVLRRYLQDGLELVTGLVVSPELEERPSKRDTRGQICRVPEQTGLASDDGVVELTGAAVFLRQRGKRDGRRVQLDPALQFFDSRAVGHAGALANETAVRHRSLPLAEKPTGGS
jgi:hypothetical protein